MDKDFDPAVKTSGQEPKFMHKAYPTRSDARMATRGWVDEPKLHLELHDHTRKRCYQDSNVCPWYLLEGPMRSIRDSLGLPSMQRFEGT